MFPFWAYLMKVIVSVPDEGYCERTWWRLLWAYLMKVIASVPDEGYSERTWWRLLQKHVVCIKFDIYVLFLFEDKTTHVKCVAETTYLFGSNKFTTES